MRTSTPTTSWSKSPGTCSARTGCRNTCRKRTPAASSACWCELAHCVFDRACDGGGVVEPRGMAGVGDANHTNVLVGGGDAFAGLGRDKAVLLAPDERRGLLQMFPA